MTTINNWYIFNGVKGVIADMDNEKFAGVKPVATNGNFGFYSLASLEGKDITDKDCALEYYDTETLLRIVSRAPLASTKKS